MGRDRDFNHTRGVVRVHELLHHGVNCSLSTNNVLNPFTPFGDCSLIRIANLYANIAHAGMRDFADCFDMVTKRSAKLLRRDDYGLEPGKSADLVVLDCTTREEAVSELAVPLYGLKRGRMSFSRKPVELFRP
jgi:cytosine deaminase